ncbi:UDP-N-acetylmuramoyl-L-alanine--D-glutamate ligase [Alteripontixanthobacter maritimus]|uniref:UDP-N-acetylmuramoylalanine--D-glutamate ligase n=1 Tax=Alteripontixanthobacter maritimus TaxID=2161824 RepID=A0A369Q7T6_9SPHN|nr:UDP-N-acetylmuramoyl-L-alanine--D-glutamate ligase [Alteripontixanthobacter maritimus]RDC59347.1 UDP-N-acetylmuramoyl-L-alanine--D-glutamate ligase [Alteripontixanthobacter maritimus]
MITSPFFAGKRYAVLGLARSGLAAVESLLESGAQVTVWDRQDEARSALADRFGDRVTLADPLEISLAGFDGVVVSPGVPLNTHPISARAAQFGVPVIGDIELFALARAALPPHRVIGITGTNGKSTATALVAHLLDAAGLPVRMGGNIGLPVLAEDPLQPNDAGAGVYVLELSSYQIDLTRSLACEAAVLLNVTPDHLDRYDGFEAYAFSKSRLFAMQGSTQFAVFGSSDAVTRGFMNAAAERRPEGRIVSIGAVIGREGLAALQPAWPSLQGPHNLENTGAAVALVEAMGVTRSQWEPALASFSGLPHRMERLGTHDGVLFVNDSKATNQASTAPALAAFPPADDARPRIHWIVGGLAKEDGLGECEAQLGCVAAAYTIGEAGPRFAEMLEGRVPVTQSEMLCEAVRGAIAAAKPGDVVLLSPACASFDQFRDFAKRGDAFRHAVSVLAQDNLAGDPCLFPADAGKKTSSA